MDEKPDENNHQEEALFDDEDSDVSGSDEDGEEGESDGSESEQSEAGDEVGASGVSSDESDGGSDKCAICLQKFHGQELGLPETCEHYFCLRCLTEWSKKVTTCPVDRKVFSSILVKEDVSGPVVRVVDVEVSNVDNPALFDEYYDTDPTYCEICGHCDREDRLLLCDNCDLGFHLECLEPPLEYVPIEDWYCPTCEAQRIASANEASVSQPRATRRQLRLPRTGQSRRLIESIRYATRQTTPDTSSRTTVPRSQGTRRSGGKTKTKKKTYRRRSTKKAGGGRKRKRKTRKGKKRSRVATDRRPATTKGRLAVQLGIVPPRPGQVYVGLPTCRSAGTRAGGEANCSALRSLRHQAGITPLRIFSTSDDLADFVEVDSDDDGPVGVARPRAVHRHAPVKPSLPSTRSMHQNSSDILGPILNNQMIMLTDRNIHVNRDGTLIPSVGNPLRNLNSINSTANGSRSRPNGIGGSPDSGARRTPGSPSSNDVNSHGTPGFTNNNDAINRDANSYSKESSSTARRDSGSSWSSPPAANDPSGARAYEQFLQASSPPDDSPSKAKPEESQSKKHVDEDEGTYSDIEADDTSQDIEKSAKLSSNTGQDQKNGPEGSDSELLIDEEGRSLLSVAQTHHSGSLPEPSAELSVDESVKICLDDVPSPDSIPLPDSTPPPSAIHDGGSDSDEEEVSQETESSKSKQTKEEYDPSQPLTSSDEEEHSAKLSVNRKKQQKPASKTSTRRRSTDEAEEIDLSSIPMPSDDYKKPAPEKIQFSIPTRHKLVSISSLIKRQRGVTKKESRTSNNFSLEISKAFGDEKQDSDEESQEVVDGAPKLSLVAEIFGSDEEEVQDTQQDNTTSEITEDRALEPEVALEQSSSEPIHPNVIESADTSRWKTVEESNEAVSVPQVSATDVAATVNADSDSDDSIAVVDTVQRSQTEDDDIQFISISKSTTKIASNNQGMPKPKSVEKSRTSVLESISDGDSEFESKSDESSKSSEEKEPSRTKRRKLSILSGNAEEGEIVDSPEKRRKRKKEKKKGKKRRKSKEDKTRFLFSEKRPNSSDPKTAGQISSEEENQSGSVSWKKPTHSAKERNYRDGKPKPEEKYFKTTPKKREASPKRVEKPKEPSERERPAKDKPRSSQKGRSRSRSKSNSKDRGATKRINSRPRRSVSSTRSRGSRSRSRSNRRARRRRRLSTSPRRSRSRSRGSQTRRSRSPFRSRRRSSSFNNSRRRKIRRRSNSSASSGSSRPGGRRQKGRIEGRDRKKKPKEAEKTKEKPTEVKDVKDKDKEREKDKKKRKRRKEKSISPAKAIFADGDSIVVSLNFQKNTAVNATKDSSPSKNDSEGEKKRNKRVRHTRTNSQTEGDGKPKFLKKTLLIDLETSPIQEQNIGLSPTLIVLSDDEDGEHKKGSKNDDGATSNGSLDRPGRSESPFGKLPGINDGSLIQGQNESLDKLLNNGSLSPSENSNLTPVRLGNATNTAREQENGLLRSRKSRSLSRSPLNDDNMDIEPHSPAGSPPPLPSNTTAPMHSVGGRGNDVSVNAGSSQSSSSGLFHNKPVGGNLTNLFGNSNLTVGGVPPPLMIPAPQVQQVRFPTGVNQNVFTTNLLASLYGPILAARQQQQGPGGSNAANTNSRNSNSNTNILLPKNQLAQSSHSRSKGTGQTAPGDSPFSPNSSDGDDLFEPPIDRGNGETVGRTDKPLPQSSSTSGAGTSGSSKPKGTLFDSLFGSTSKKSSTPVKSHGKQSKSKPGGNQSKQKSKKHKKEVVKLTEGELRLTEDVPNSAVELRVKEKFLKKLNRQERVVEEVKLALKPHYSKKHVTKDEYKDILRRAVPKICHNKSGEINPSKIRELIEAYVKKIRHGRKKDA